MNPVKQEQEYLKAYDAYADNLFRHAYFRVSDRERALDIVQDTFVKVWDYLVSGGEVREFRPFLYRTLNNLIIDEYRKKKSASLDAMLEGETVSESSFDDLKEGSLQELEEQLDAKRFMGELAALPDAYREMVVMRYIDELSPQEIASITGESENNVSVRIHRGLAWLKKNTSFEY